MVPAIDPSVEVGGPHHIVCTAIHRNSVAVLVDMEREGAKGSKSRKQNRGGEVFGCSRGDKVCVRKPYTTLDFGTRQGSTVNEKTWELIT